MVQTGEIVRLTSADAGLRDGFMRWQCRVRQIIMRENQGRPGEAIMPALTLPGAAAPMGQIITVMSKAPQYSRTPEMRHLARKTNDPALRREAALTFFSETYYQRAAEFSEILSATFPPGSPGAARIREAGRATLTFAAYNQRYDLACRVWTLAEHNPLHQATYWHNLLFNPELAADTIILGFEPDWSCSTADPRPR
ncbi:MAG: hypothetical protein IID49_15085 [Proteobacteria bacterium]|nr:hypothetical protein [Pseudomonadota bacterium]MCH8953426.1 hypothetical protein [Pseudomonadota bacterium]